MIYVKDVLPMFPYRSFMISSPTFRSLINFEFIFVHGVRQCSFFFNLGYFFYFVYTFY